MRETHRRAPTPWEAFQIRLRTSAEATVRVVVLAGVLLPFLAIAFLTLDRPVATFDVFSVEEDYLNPSAWLTQGQLWMMASLLVVILASRRYGDAYATSQLMLAWGAAAVLLAAGLSYLAPQLEASDLPPVRFVATFVAAWMMAQFACVTMFELTRAVKWWRAPLFGALFGSAVFCVIYFPFLYSGSKLPWLNWMVTDFAIKAGLAFVFLAPYAMLRGVVPPRPGLGGR